MNHNLAIHFFEQEYGKLFCDSPASFEPWGRYRISFIIAARPEQIPYVALNSLRALNLSRERFEIIVAYGNRPALQRNQAARQATGNFLYFLDDDTTVSHTNLACLDQTLRQFAVNPNELILGGPVVLPPSAEPFEKALGLAFASPLGIGPYRFRYSREGEARFATERDLILANLLISRDLFLQSEGFKEDLYPGEENQWLKRVTAAGIRPLYHPQFAAYRRQRASFKTVFQLGLTYGEGRAKHFFEHVQPLDLILLAPSILVGFTIYAMLTNSVLIAGLVFGYFAAIVVASVTLSKFSGALFKFTGIFTLLHYGYGLGFLKGLLFKKTRRPPAGRVEIKFHNLKNLLQPPALGLS